jgi:hypothetical protein
MPRANRVVSQFIDQDKRAGLVILAVKIESNRSVRRKMAHRNFVERELSSGNVFECVDVYFVSQVRDARARHARADFHQIRSARKQRLLVHPNDESA